MSQKLQGIVNEMSKTINRLLVFSVILLHLAVKLSSKYQNFEEKIRTPQISFIYKPEKYNGVQAKNYTFNIGSALFFSVSTIGFFLIHFGSRESQLYFLLPGQCMLTTVLFPGFIIASNKKLQNQFFRDYRDNPFWEPMWIYMCKDNKIMPII